MRFMGKKTETEKEMKNRTFNIVISGTGGQGLITLLQIIAEAALMKV